MDHCVFSEIENFHVGYLSPFKDIVICRLSIELPSNDVVITPGLLWPPVLDINRRIYFRYRAKMFQLAYACDGESLEWDINDGIYVTQPLLPVEPEADTSSYLLLLESLSELWRMSPSSQRTVLPVDGPQHISVFANLGIPRRRNVDINGSFERLGILPLKSAQSIWILVLRLTKLEG